MGKVMNTDNIKAENTDRCIRKAISMQPQFRLASNFSYKMMEKINEKVILQEKRREKRTLIAIIITSLLMVSTCILIILNYTNIKLTDITNKLSNISIPSETLFYLPMLITLPLLLWFNYWLRKKFGYLLKRQFLQTSLRVVTFPLVIILPPSSIYKSSPIMYENYTSDNRQYLTASTVDNFIKNSGSNGYSPSSADISSRNS